MKRSYLAGTFIIILLFILCITGCSTLRPLYGDRFHISRSKPRASSHGEKSLLRKKVLIAPVINIAGLKDEKAGQLSETWLNLLKEDNSLLVTQLTGFESPQLVSKSSGLGVFTDPVIIKKAEEMGMNTLVTLILEPLNYTAKKGFIWPFNKVKGEYDVTMVVNAVDITSGTVIYSYKESEKIKIGKVPEGQETPIPLDTGALDNVLYELQKRQSSALLDVLAGQLWTGKILHDEGKIRINGGKDIGITAGSVFEVFNKGEGIESLTGASYYIDGPKTGEIKVTEVTADHSFAVPTEEKIFEDGLIIALKSE